MSSQDGLAQRFLEGYGLIELGVDRLVAELSRRQPSKPPWPWRSKFSNVSESASVTEALEFLSTLSWPATRHVLFPVRHCWTVIINNSRNGSDFADYVGYLSYHLKVRTVRVVAQPSRLWRRGTQQVTMSHEARLVTIHEQSSEPLKSIICMDDGGRWSFHCSGPVHPIENSFDYSAKRVRDRFTLENLHSFLSSAGFPDVDAKLFLEASAYALMREDHGPAVRVQECTLAEREDPAYGYYLRGLSYVAHMETHAESVVVDLERAIEINSQYEPRVRGYLEQARSILAKTNNANGVNP